MAFTLGFAMELPRFIPPDLAAVARNRLLMLNRINSLADLAERRGLHLEKLRGDLDGFWSIRLNDRYRVTFKWLNNGAYEVKVSDHYRKV